MLASATCFWITVWHFLRCVVVVSAYCQRDCKFHCVIFFLYVVCLERGGNLKGSGHRSVVAGHKKKWCDIRRVVFYVESSCVRRERNCKHCLVCSFDEKDGVILYKSHWSVKCRKNSKCHYAVFSSVGRPTNRRRGYLHSISSQRTNHCNMKNEDAYLFVDWTQICWVLLWVGWQRRRVCTRVSKGEIAQEWWHRCLSAMMQKHVMWWSWTRRLPRGKHTDCAAKDVVAVLGKVAELLKQLSNCVLVCSIQLADTV